MLEDALLDPSHRGDIVLEPFLGSGSALIASEKTGGVFAAGSNSTRSMSM
jgi:DNA modification methylase